MANSGLSKDALKVRDVIGDSSADWLNVSFISDRAGISESAVNSSLSELLLAGVVEVRFQDRRYAEVRFTDDENSIPPRIFVVEDPTTKQKKRIAIRRNFGDDGERPEYRVTVMIEDQFFAAYSAGIVKNEIFLMMPGGDKKFKILRETF